MLSVSGPKVCGGGGGCWVCKLISVLSFVQAEQWFGHEITQRPILIAKTPLLNKTRLQDSCCLFRWRCETIYHPPNAIHGFRQVFLRTLKKKVIPMQLTHFCS